MKKFNLKNVIEYLVSRSRFQKNLLVMSLDYVILILAFWLSLSIRVNDFFVPAASSLYLIILAPIIAIPIFYFFGLYQSLVRYSSYRSVFTIIIAISLYSFFWFLIVYFVEIVVKPYDFLIINWLLTIFFITGARYIARYFLLQKSHQTKKVIIYGAGAAGTQIYFGLSLDPDIKVIGFVDDTEELHNRFIEGIKVYSPDSLGSVIKKKKVSEVYIAIPSASSSEIARIVQFLKHFEIKIRKLPAIGDLASGKISISDLRNIRITDLLKREQRRPVQHLMEKNITDKNVLITGAGGSIGSELALQIIKLKPTRLILLDISEYSLYKLEQMLSSIIEKPIIFTVIGDVTDQKRLERILSNYSVHTIYHAAAYKHVPMVEKNSIAGIHCNIFGTLSCIKAATNQSVASFVFISTDKAVRPTNIMGATKRFAEQILQSIKLSNNRPIISIVRFGNVLGSSGSVVPLFKSQIESGGPLTVTDPEITRYFMTLQEAAQLVIQAGAMGNDRDIFLLDMGSPVKVLDLAKDMIKLSGKSVKDKDNPDGDISIEFTGLRPGEKLFEELLIGDGSDDTDHEKIFKARDKNLSWSQINDWVLELEKACIKEDYIKIKEIFLKCIDGYAPKSVN